MLNLVFKHSDFLAQGFLLAKLLNGLHVKLIEFFVGLVLLGIIDKSAH